MPEIRGEDGEEPYFVHYESGVVASIRPSHDDPIFSGEDTIKEAARQNNITVTELIKKLQAGENIVYKSDL